jgi:hypothetical protein
MTTPTIIPAQSGVVAIIATYFTNDFSVEEPEPSVRMVMVVGWRIHFDEDDCSSAAFPVLLGLEDIPRSNWVSYRGIIQPDGRVCVYDLPLNDCLYDEVFADKATFLAEVHKAEICRRRDAAKRQKVA